MLHQPSLIAAIVVALAAACTDARTRRVPNALVAGGAAAGILLNAWAGGAAGLRGSLLGCLTGFLVFLPFFLLRGMGGGDVKLMAALGACLQTVAVLQVALVASFAGALFALVVAARRGLLKRTFSGAGRLLGSWLRRGPSPSAELTLDNPDALTIPYALPIAAGALVIVFTALSAS
jgi:prepilin peptidase CpaA